MNTDHAVSLDIHVDGRRAAALFAVLFSMVVLVVVNVINISGLLLSNSTRAATLGP